MTILFYKGLTRNPEIGNTPVSALPNIWRLGWVRDTKFGTNAFNKILLNAAKYQDDSFYRFWVIKGKPIGSGVSLPPPPPPIQSQLSKTENIQQQFNKFSHNSFLFLDVIADIF